MDTLSKSTVLAILLVGLALRLWGIDFGLPHDFLRPDEHRFVTVALGPLSGDLNPQFFIYPSFYFYLLGAVYAVGALFSSRQARSTSCGNSPLRAISSIQRLSCLRLACSAHCSGH